MTIITYLRKKLYSITPLVHPEVSHSDLRAAHIYGAECIGGFIYLTLLYIYVQKLYSITPLVHPEVSHPDLRAKRTYMHTASHPEVFHSELRAQRTHTGRIR